MAYDISSLPAEVLIGIFQFLDVRSRLKASLVSKTWLQIMDHPQLLSDVKIQFSGEVDETIKCFSRMTRHFQWFSFCKVIISGPVVEFLKDYSNQFVILSFTDCEVSDDKSESKLQDKILHCNNLRTLDAFNSDIVTLFATLPNLTELNIRLFSDLSDYVIYHLSKSLSKLEKLSLAANVVYKEEAYKTFYVNEKEMENNPSQNILSFPCIKLLIEKNRTTLRYINFLCLRLSAEDALTISKIEGLKLRRVSICEQWNSTYFEQFCENQLSLEAIDLTLSMYVGDDTISAICKCLRNLKELVLFAKRTIDKCIIQIFQLQNLVKLDLSCCSNISQLSYQKAVLDLKTVKLKYLSLSFSKISDDDLFKVLKFNQNIRYLNVSSTCISNKTLNMICKHLILLKCLILSSCPAISDSGLTGEFENCTDSVTPTPLSNLKYLKELNLNQNSLITKEGCVKAIRFPKLEKLSLYKCGSVVLSEEFEMKMKKQNPCVTLLILNETKFK